MRVLHVISGLNPAGGGPSIAVLGLAAAQASVGMNVRIAATWTPAMDMKPAEALADRGVELHPIGPASGRLMNHPEIRPKLEILIRESDVVHIHGLWEEIQHQASRIAQRLNKPYIITPHGMLDKWALRQGWLKKKLYMLWRMRCNLDRAAALHLTTQMEAEQVAALHLASRTLVEPLGIDLSEFERLPEPGTFRKRYPQLSSRPYVVYLGRLHPQKGLELLVPAFARLKTNEAMLVLAGPDSEGFQTEVQRLIDENRLRDRVILTGMLKGADRVAALADAALFSLPSFHENFGVSVIEALAAGVPVVISDHVYIHNEISAGRVGGVVRLDIDELAVELDRWLGDEKLRADAAARAPAFVRERYDWRIIAGHWAKHYRELSR